MTTMTAPAAPVKAARKGRPLSCSLTLAINGQPYDVTVFKAEAPEVGRVFHLEKPNGDSYDVSEHPHGPECTCPDFECRRRGLDSLGCKHIRSLRALGLMLEPLASPEALEAPQSDRDATPAPETTAAPPACCDATEADPCRSCAPTDAAPLEPASFADELATAVGPIAPADEPGEYEPTDQDLAELHRISVEAEARELGLIPHEADPADWPSWTDEDPWEPTEDDQDELLTLDQLIDHEADRYRRVGTLAGEMIGRHLAELASMVRFVRAATPEQALDRIYTLERDQVADQRARDRRD